MQTIKNGFGIETAYRFEWNDVRCGIIVLNVILIMLFGLRAGPKCNFIFKKIINFFKKGVDRYPEKVYNIIVPRGTKEKEGYLTNQKGNAT